MNYLFLAAELGVSYAFPEVGAAFMTCRYAYTAYNVAKAAVSYFSGDAASGTINLLRAATAAECLNQRDICVRTCMSGLYGPTDAASCVVGCDLAYRVCLMTVG